MPHEKETTPAKQNFLGEEAFNLPQLEEKVLRFWDERGIFEKSLKKNETNGEKFVFYEGPPYANGRPALHHILARVVKDVILRFKTMQGYYVPRRAGWDTHGLPVEMAAEKVLGFKTKRDIEQFGVQKFNEEAKKQVWIHRDEWERLTNRIGYWLDLRNAYVTYAPEYIESIWWTLAQISKRNVGGESLLFKGHKVVPWCTRCGTALSSHELAQGYKEVVDKSVYVKFHLKPNQTFGKYTTKDSAYILSWTTTPWTLPGNVALAIGEKISYTALRVKDVKELYILARDLVKVVFKDQEVEIVHDDIKGKDLVGLEYEPLFEVAPLQKPNAYKIYAADFVTTTDGTGVVHTAVMYGEDDYELGKKVGLPQHHTVSEEGKFLKDVPELAGEYVKAHDTEEHIFALLKERGNLLRIEEYRHEYPFCWRCGTALLYYARTSWFIGMSRLRAELLKNNETIHWMPEHVKEGRFGEWLREAKDWNLSRERYWGAPLPIWECAKCGRTEVVESLERLSQLAGGAKNKYWVMRHGESEGNIFNIADSGSQNFHLTPKGKIDSKISLDALKKELTHKKIDIIFTSDILRAKETGEIAADIFGVAPKIDKRLNEINWGAEFEGKPIARYVEKLPTYESRFNNMHEGGESLRQVRQRMWSFLRDCEKEYDGKNILIVSHGDPIWMILQIGCGWSEKKTIEERTNKDGLYPAPGVVQELPLKTISRDDTGLIDLHRPFVDEIFWKCIDKKCDGEMKRVRAVADVWYDSGAMPYAQAHYPFDVDRAGLEFPADYIAEGIDQTRGWFYTMLAIATALGYEAPYRNVITFGLMNDKFGNKMSKSKGNVIEPFEIIDKYGVDAVRWYFYAGTPFGEPKNFDEAEVAKKLRQVHLIIYNSFVFWKTYAKKGIGNWRQIAEQSENVLDRWILARFAELAGSVTTKLKQYQVREAALEIEGFVDDLSRWYIRRSRRRLQRPVEDEAGVRDYEAASAALGFVLMQLAKLMAPFTPFFSEILHAALGGGKESVHLEEWPVAVDSGRGGAASVAGDDEKLIKNMMAVRELAALGLAKRAEAKVKVRQPLQSLTIKNETLKNDEHLLAILADEVNVKEILFDAKLAGDVELDTAITSELREEGLVREVARMVQELRQKAGLEPRDQVALMIELPTTVRAAVEHQELAFKRDVGAKTIEYKRLEKFDAEEVAKIEGDEVWIGLRKV